MTRQIQPVPAPITTGTSDLPPSFYYTQKIDFTKPIDTSNLKDKSVVITGGASGIGEGAVTAFAEAGAFVTIVDLSDEAGPALAKQLSSRGLNVQFAKADVTSFQEQNEAFKKAISFSPRQTIDIALACAGVTTTPLSTWLEENASGEPSAPDTSDFDINLTGTFYTTYLALHYFQKTSPTAAPASGETLQSKQLILMGSTVSYFGVDDATDYQASKFGVRGIWKSIRHSRDIFSEHTPFRTNLIAPSWINTPMIRPMIPVLETIGHRVGEIGDVIAAIMRVASDETIYGRAVGVPRGKETPGDSNFDLRDDWEGHDGGIVAIEAIQNGNYPNLEQQMTQLRQGNRPIRLRSEYKN